MSEKRRTLLLINPANQLRPGFHINPETRNQPLGLGIIAALTPPDWKIKLIDENFKTFRYYEADLVGLTAFTSNAPRAYEIAAIYREKGIPTVMGGIHVSMLPEEGMQFVDSVVQGEAEPVWAQVLADFKAGSMKRHYVAKYEREIRQPKPRRDLFHPGYVCASIQTTRGCPLNCSFCSVSAFNGRHYRFRPIDDVIEELREIPQKFVFFIDDNIIGHSIESKERAKQLFEAIIRSGIKKYWISQSSINFADDPELLKLAYRSGGRMIFLGIESETEEHLKEANKSLNLKKGTGTYDHVFRTIRRHGIGVIAGLIFGWDSETPESIHRRVKFATQCAADSFQCSILTPLPGTGLFEKIKEEGRLIHTNFPNDWQRYDFVEPTIQHPTMDPETLLREISKAYSAIYSRPLIAWKTIRTLFSTRDFMATMMLSLNYRFYRNIYRDGSNRLLIK
jgi:radical SAM superfamily enzyme YgiQ (UPF0313 family)